jgi:hypothetical protein
VFLDPVGDAGDGPDVGLVAVTEDAAGGVTFAIDLVNRPVLLAGDSVQVYIETDPGTPGDEFLLADYDDASAPLLARWSGSDWAIVRYLDDVAYESGTVTFHVTAQEIDAPAIFGLAVATFVHDDFETHIDVAPDIARDTPIRWYFEPAVTTSPPPPPAPPPPATTSPPSPPPASPPPAPAPPPPAPPPAPAPPPSPPAAPSPPPPPAASPPRVARLSVSALRLAPPRPRHGGSVTATISVRLAGNPVRPSAVSCRAAAGVARASVLRKRLASGTAACTWRVPRGSRGRALRGTVSVTAGGRSAQATFSRPIA